MAPIIDTASHFIESKKWPIELILPVPPSRKRDFQPVFLIAEGIGNHLGINCCMDCIEKVKNTEELKNVGDFDERLRILKKCLRNS